MEKLRKVVIDNLPVGILVLGADGTIREATPSACTILGCEGGGFTGRRFGEAFLEREENAEFSEIVLEAIQRDTPKIERVTPYFSPDGSRKYLSVISSVLREGGKITDIVIIIEDLTELHKMHEREKEILALNHRLASERAEILITFASSVAHQVRNPMMAIAGMARLMEKNADEKAMESLEAIREEAQKLEAIVKAVSDFSAITIADRKSIALREIIEDAQLKIDAPGAAWRIECPAVTIAGDRVLLAKALAEIMRNSVEFSGPQAKISLIAAYDGATITVTVADDGPGFDDRSLAHALDPFYSTKPVGVGMGLTTAKRIIREHQGMIDLANADPSGARVTVTLPLTPL